MALYGEVNDRPIISFSPGRHFDEKAFYDLQAELAAQGWASISHSYDVDYYVDPKDGHKKLLKIEDHAKKRNEAVAATGATSSIEFGWSWGANPALHPGSDEVPVVKIILAAGAPHKNTVRWLGKHVPEIAHPVNYAIYEPSADKDHKAAEELLRTCILSTVTDESIIFNWARKMGPHPRVSDESLLAKAPSVPIDYIVLSEDKSILNQEDYEDRNNRKTIPGIAKQLAMGANVNILRFKGDHGSVISAPQELAAFVAKNSLEVILEEAAAVS